VIISRRPTEDIGNAHFIPHPERDLELLRSQLFADFISETKPATLVLIVGINQDSIEVENDTGFLGKVFAHGRESTERGEWCESFLEKNQLGNADR
jgi:hypothetical protein